MIPQNALREWSAISAPWADLAQVEQDLAISRALVEFYNDSFLAQNFAFRGGTAMQKLFFDKPARYSEDIDLVQLREGPIGPALDAIRERLDPWLGPPKRSRKDGRFTLLYHYHSETPPTLPMRLKVEVNNVENFSVFELQKIKFEVKSIWFSGVADILTYSFEELLGTKLRALYQRRKGRDFFDMAISLEKFKNLDCGKVIQSFQRYLEHQKLTISRAQFEANLAEKLVDKTFLNDLIPLLRPDSPHFDWKVAEKSIRTNLIERLPGAPWKGP